MRRRWRITSRQYHRGQPREEVNRALSRYFSGVFSSCCFAQILAGSSWIARLQLLAGIRIPRFSFRNASPNQRCASGNWAFSSMAF